MHYIRFLKTPKCTVEHGGLEMTTLITIASDLGESFFPDEVKLEAQIICGQSTCAKKEFQWTGSMRSLKIHMKIPQKPKSLFKLKIEALNINDVFKDAEEDVIMLPIVLDAWSAHVDPRGKLETERMVERRFHFSRGEELCMWEETGESLARHLWPGGVTLMFCIDRSLTSTSGLPSLDALLKRDRKHSLRAIELGAGCGLVGLALAKLVPNIDVLLTDLTEAEDITNRNIPAAAIKKPSKASFDVLDLTQPLPDSTSGKPFDLVLVADCTYNADFIPALVDTLTRLMKTSPHALIVLSTKTRHSSEAVFFEQMGTAKFEIIDQSHALAPTRYPIEEPEDAERVDVYCFKQELPDRQKRGREGSPLGGDNQASRPRRKIGES